MSKLAVGDLVLGRDGATIIVAVQHQAVETLAKMLTFHTADGAISMTPDHAVYVDGILIAAADAQVGTVLSTGAKITRIIKGEGAIINPVTRSGTVVANGFLAASNPYWIASLTVDAPLMRAAVNLVLYTASDVDSLGAGAARVSASLALIVAKAVAVLAVIGSGLGASRLAKAFSMLKTA